jgi:hypothetical protein
VNWKEVESTPARPVEEVKQSQDREHAVPSLFKDWAERTPPLPPPDDPPQVLPEDRELAQLGRLPRRSTKPARANYRKVERGLTLNLVAAAILLGTFVLGLIFILASSKAILDATEPQNLSTVRPPNGPPIGFLLLGFLLVISQGVDLVGLTYCLAAPRKDAARSWVLACLIAAAAGLPLVFGGGVLQLVTRAGALGIALLILGILLLCSSKVLYLIFVRALGLAMEVLTLARQIYLIIFLVILAGLFHVTILAASSFGLTGEILGVVSGLGTGAGLQDVSVSVFIIWGASLLILLYALIRFVITINDARGEVIYHMARRHDQW